MRSQGVLVFAPFFSLSKTEYIRLESDCICAGREGCYYASTASRCGGPPRARKRVGGFPHAYHARRPQQLLCGLVGRQRVLGGHRSEKRIFAGYGLQHEVRLLHDPQRVHFGVPQIRASQATECPVLRSRLPRSGPSANSRYREPNAQHAPKGRWGRHPPSTHYDHRLRSRRTAVLCSHSVHSVPSECKRPGQHQIRKALRKRAETHGLVARFRHLPH